MTEERIKELALKTVERNYDCSIPRRGRNIADLIRTVAAEAREEGMRPEVYWFAQCMERELQEHDDRPGWIGEDPGYLLERLLEEVAELDSVVCSASSTPTDIIGEAADVANMAMMLADQARYAANIPLAAERLKEKV